MKDIKPGLSPRKKRDQDGDGSAGGKFVGLWGGRTPDEDRRYFAEYKAERHKRGLD
jgi:hypothetical protein